MKETVTTTLSVLALLFIYIVGFTGTADAGITGINPKIAEDLNNIEKIVVIQKIDRIDGIIDDVNINERINIADIKIDKEIVNTAIQKQVDNVVGISRIDNVEVDNIIAGIKKIGGINGIVDEIVITKKPGIVKVNDLGKII